MIQKIDHVGIAVPKIKDAMFFFTALGKTIDHEEDVPTQKVKVAFIQVGDVNIELLEPTTEDSPVAGFLAKRGSGIHHICYEVDNIQQVLNSLNTAGVALIDKEPRLGAHNKLVAFVHPKSTNGVLVELSMKQSAV